MNGVLQNKRRQSYTQQIQQMISQDVSLQNMDFQDEDIQRAVSLYENLNATACYYTAALRSPDGLGPVRGVRRTGRGGPERVRGDVKLAV